MKRVFCALVVGSLTILGGMQAALACGHQMAEDTDLVAGLGTIKPLPQEGLEALFKPTVLTAERAFNAGKYRQAIQMGLSAKPALQNRSTSYQKTGDDLEKRAARIVAVSMIRLKGKVTADVRAKKLKKRVKSTSRKNIAWATDILNALHLADKEDSEIAGYLGEALSLGNKKDKARAFDILKDFGERDLLVDGHGYAVLAKLYKAEKAFDKASAATKQCMNMENDTKICGKPAPKKVVKTPKALAQKGS